MFGTHYKSKDTSKGFLFKTYLIKEVSIHNIFFTYRSLK